jgi:hypothetical protein
MSGFTPVQRWTNVATRNVSSQSKAFSSVPTAGNIIFACGEFARDATLTSISDDTGDGVAWTAHTNSGVVGTAFAYIYLYYKKMGTPSGGGKTVTATMSGVSGEVSLHISEFSGNDSSVALDGTVPTGTGTGLSQSGGTVITTSAGSLIIVIGSSNNIAMMIPISTNNVIVRSLTQDWSGIHVCDYIATAAGSYTTDFVTGNSCTWAVMTAGFKSNGQSGGGYPVPGQ